jgi:hypothetical protein
MVDDARTAWNPTECEGEHGRTGTQPDRSFPAREGAALKLLSTRL